ncbi:nicotinamide mononucleotide transporter [Zhihengliuella sp.]|uniref:nicotinamide mononucleotide transporter n=1 Tax=Zhihengliuella sp. TaxID=1954483 RepID=UPI002811697C|nr:nicotinamide mononucleotide transporter [Zhihengliuella sp.]
MDQIFSTLFNQPLGSDSALQVALSALSTLLTAVALMLLAHRNDLGWWVQIVAVFAGPLIIALTFGYEGLLSAVPSLAVAAYGLWRFSRFALRGRFTRNALRAPLRPRQFGWGLVLAVLLTALGLGQMLTSGFVFQSGTASIWIAYGCAAVIGAALVGIANGVRWAWLAAAAAGAVNVGVLVAGGDPALGTLFSLVLLALAAGYGWFVWGALPAPDEHADVRGSGTLPDGESAGDYPPHPYRDAPASS